MALDFAIRAKERWLPLVDEEDREEVEDCLNSAIEIALRAQDEALCLELDWISRKANA